jgi:hypothetical protein
VLNRLVEANGAKVAGRFATGEPYRFEANQIAVITAATATLDGEDLGLPSSPPQPIEDGDVKNMPLHCYADVYVPVQERETEGAPRNRTLISLAKCGFYSIELPLSNPASYLKG